MLGHTHTHRAIQGCRQGQSMGLPVAAAYPLMPNTYVISKLFCQQMHSLLKHKMLQLTIKISLYMAPTCFSPLGPSSGSIRRNVAKDTVFVGLLVKIHH
jgi:hypothetical protein